MGIRSIIFLTLLTNIAWALPSKTMLIWAPKNSSKQTLWVGQTEASDWKWGVLPMNEEVADVLAELDTNKKYKCTVKASETMGYTTAYITGIFSLEECKSQ